MKFRTLLLGLAALFIASAAAFFSVTGLSKLFAGASTAVILMASSLEFGKLISAGFLYNYWDKINKALRAYLLIGVGVLIIITSAGIYGFLTSAYQVTADQLGVVDKQTEVVNLKKSRFEEQLKSYNDEKIQLTQTISALSGGLSNNVQTYKDKNGNILSSSSSANRRVLTTQLNEAKEQRNKVDEKIEVLTDSITKLELKVLDVQQSSEVAGEVGPLKFMAEITGKPMSTIVNWFALLIIFVFDPLAVTLVIAFNTALKIDKGEDDKKKVIQKRELYGEYETLPKDKENESFGSPSTESKEKQTQREALVEMMKGDEELGLYDEPILVSEKDAEIFFNEIENPSEPNEKLVEALQTYKETIEPEIDELSTLTKVVSRRGIDIDGDGTIDGYDNTGDGLIDEFAPKSSRRAQYAKNEKPYYARPNFNWGDRQAWINDQNAVNYWLTYVKNDKDTSYPTDFDSKTY
jgi:hypothetical protein